MLDLERLRALHAVSTHGSVSAAADAMHVTTSAISQQVAKLERETGQKLFERQGRGVRLTDAAELLVGHADRILSLVEEAQSDLEAHRGAVVGELTVGSLPTAIRGLGPGALGLLRRRHPQLRILLREYDPGESVPRVLRGDLDLAIVQDWDNDPLALHEGLESGMICEDLADAALAADHPLADREDIALKELAGERWISSTQASLCQEWLTYTLRSAGLEPVSDHSVTEYATQLSLVAAGLGAAILPRLGRCDLPEGVRIVPLRPPLLRRIYAIWRVEAARRPAIRATLEALRDAAPRPVSTSSDQS